MPQAEPEEFELEIPENLEEWEHVARAAAARPGVVGRIIDVIDRLVAAGRPIDDPPQRAGPSGTYHPAASPEPTESENDENVPVAATSRKRKRPRNPFILDEAENEDDEEENKEEEDIEPDYNDVDFIDDDDD